VFEVPVVAAVYLITIKMPEPALDLQNRADDITPYLKA
jgi:hypothetical protein